jgi:leucyl aminopeptidase
MLPHSTLADVTVSATVSKSSSAVFAFAASDPAKVVSPTKGAPSEVSAEIAALAPIASAKPGEVVTSVVSAANATHRIYVVGAGKTPTLEDLRKAGATVLRKARAAKLAEVSLLVPEIPAIPQSDVVEALATGALLASFEFRDYVGSRRKADHPVRHVKIVLVATGAPAKSAADRATAIATSVNFARTIASRPGNNINPVTLASVAKDLAAEAKLKLTVLDEKQMAKLGMGGILGVGSGSATPPRMIALEYRPSKPKNKRPLLVVGKSITFDTGGISIKGAEGMQKMIYDKSGGMAVLGLMSALSKLKPDVHVVGILTSAENHVSGTSYRPGDILTMHNGVTVEITNTDAEGRLVLGDAISWGIETFKPAAVVDLATLTGGCVVALGKIYAGLFSNDDALAAEVTTAGAAAGEKYWRLPVNDEVRDLLKSDLADVVNSAGRWASPCTGAAFVSLFVPPDNSIPWAHLDIAGTADTDKELPYLGKGSTGFGIRTLINWVESKA